MKKRNLSRRQFLERAGSSAILGMLANSIPIRSLVAQNLPRAGEADWTRFGYDLHNTRFNAKEKTIAPGNVDRLKPKWQFDTMDGWPIQSVPSVIGDSLFFGAGGFFYGIDNATGKSKWRHETGLAGEWVSFYNGMIRTSAQYVDGKVYFGTGFADVICVDAATGRQLWKTPMETNKLMRAQMLYSPVVYNGKVFVGWSSGQAGIACLDAETGAVRWRWRVGQDVPDAYGTGGGSLWTSGAIDEQYNILYNVTGSNKAFMPNDNRYTESIVAHDVDTGELLWADQVHKQDAFDLDFNAHPMIFDAAAPQRIRGDVRRCVAAGNKVGMYCWNRYTGERYWKTMLGGGSVRGGPSVNATGVAYNKVYIQNASPGRPPLNVTAALNAYNGDIEWIVPNPGAQSSSISLGNGVLYQAMNDGTVEALDAMNGRRLWGFKLPSGSHSGPCIANGALYVANGEPQSWEGQKMPYKYSLHCFTIDGR